MKFSISTHWNAGRHTYGEEIIDEILELGIDQVELGYDLRLEMVPGVQKRVKEGAVKVVSVHNYCPVPEIAPEGHPELFTLADSDWKVRESAILYTTQSIRLAAEFGAKVVVIHCGNVEMKNLTQKLLKLCDKGKRIGNAYERTKHKLITKREKFAGKHLDYLRKGIDRLLPVLTETGVRLGLENLPSWEAIPTEMECENLICEFGSEYICYWHDVGHGQIRENLGFINHLQALQGMSRELGGMHVHDVAPIATDHAMPPNGTVDFPALKPFVQKDIPLVLEPSSQLSLEEVKAGYEIIREHWTTSPEEGESPGPKISEHSDS